MVVVVVVVVGRLKCQLVSGARERERGVAGWLAGWLLTGTKYLIATVSERGCVSVMCVCLLHNSLLEVSWWMWAFYVKRISHCVVSGLAAVLADSQHQLRHNPAPDEKGGWVDGGVGGAPQWGM